VCEFYALYARKNRHFLLRNHNSLINDEDPRFMGENGINILLNMKNVCLHVLTMDKFFIDDH
jgi:hypothetical protein